MVWWNPFSWPPTSIFASGTISVGLFLGLWQWYEKRARHGEMDSTEHEFFRRQDLRRWVGIGMMFLLAAAIFLVDTRAGSAAPQNARYFVQVANLLGLVGLILGLLSLALVDAMATYRYARRNRRVLANEHAEIMREVIRRSAGSGAIPRGDDRKRRAPEG
jgi:peptidoglycan/LPS O-acetylase OafA/YrhL